MWKYIAYRHKLKMFQKHNKSILHEVNSKLYLYVNSTCCRNRYWNTIIFVHFHLNAFCFPKDAGFRKWYYANCNVFHNNNTNSCKWECTAVARGIIPWNYRQCTSAYVKNYQSQHNKSYGHRIQHFECMCTYMYFFIVQFW
jgi:hypothetical protein